MADDRSPGARRPEGPLRRPDEPLTDGVIALDEPTEADVEAIVVSADDDAAARWLSLPSPYTADDAREWLALARQAQHDGASLEFAIRDAVGGDYLGAIGLHFGRCRAGEAEIGYLVAPHARGRGVACRAIQLLAPWAFEAYRPRRIEILVQPQNIASRRAAEAAGAAPEGVRAAALATRDGRILDAAVYAFTDPSNYPSAP